MKKKNENWDHTLLDIPKAEAELREGHRNRLISAPSKKEYRTAVARQRFQGLLDRYLE